ncbi:MAG: protein kinase [Planctomycetes bacterium]|nr:protein kinase [Planctomycetota bacterium]
MGIVYEATDEQDPRKSSVALKVLIGSASIEGKAIRRFHREAETLQRMGHPNIVPIFRIGEERGTHFYSMRLVDGETVASRLRRGPIDPRRAAGIALEAARALGYAHRLTIVHRDIKPANLILDRSGAVLLTDFGLATHERAATITDSGALVGTPMYMSPEQVSGVRNDVDARSDVYSLGATLYEMVTGSPPFNSTSVQSILRQIAETDPVPPRRRNAQLPRDLETIILKAMEKSPADRFQTADDLSADLERFVAGTPIRARRRGVHVKLLRSARRRPGVAVAIVTLAVLLAVSVGWIVSEANRRHREIVFQQLLAEAATADGSGDFARAVQKLDEAVRLRPIDPAPLLRRASVLAHADDPEGARRDLHAASKLAVQSAEPWLELGDLERRLGNADGAVEDYEEAKRREPRSPVPCLALADLVSAEGDQRRAAAELEIAKDLAPNDARVIQACAAFEMKRGRREEAERYLNLLQILNPLAAAPAGLGEKVVDSAQKQLADLRVIPETIARTPETLRKTPEAASTFFARMQANFARADAHKRVEDLTAMLGENTDAASLPALRLQRAVAFRDAGEFDAAATDFVLAMQGAAVDPEPWRLLARMHLDEVSWTNRNLKDALRFAEQAVKIDPGSPACQETMADACLSVERFDDARRILDDLIARAADGPDRERFVVKRARCDLKPR